MIYKGGPKNYSRNDWLFLKIMGGIAAIALVLGLIFHPEALQGGPKSSSATASARDQVDPMYRAAAERQGYKGKEADDVAKAAKTLCQGTGGSGC